MSKPRRVVVFEATEQLGGSVARTVAASEEFVATGVTTDLRHDRSGDVLGGGFDHVLCDPSVRCQVEMALRGAYACFLSTNTDFSNSDCVEAEVANGCLVADVCKSENVRHIIFISQLNSYNICSIMARHLVAKARIEQYMRDIDLPLTCLILPVFYEELCGTLRPKTTDGRRYDIEIPMGTTPLDMISVEDVGPVVLTTLRHRDAYLNKTLSVCGDKLTVLEMAHILSRHLRPKLFKDKPLTTHDFHQRKSRDFNGSADWANMFQFFQRVDQRYNLSVTKKLNPTLRSFDEWVQDNKSLLSSVIC